MVIILLKKETIYKTFLFSFIGISSVFYSKEFMIEGQAIESISSISNVEENKDSYNFNINSLNINTINEEDNENDIQIMKTPEFKIDGIENLGVNISGDVTYIYSEKDVTSKKLAVLPKNGVCDVIQEDNLTSLDIFLNQGTQDFILVKSGNFEGYVLSKDISLDIDEIYFKDNMIATTLSDTTYYEEIDNKLNEDETIIPKNTNLKIINYSKDNIYVETNYEDKDILIKTFILDIKPNIEYAYEYKEPYVTPNAIFESREDFETSLVEYASQFIGNKYVWGGTSLTNGIDCSGFTQAIYKHFGYNINRCSFDQINNGTRVKESDLKVGDLVFYSDGSKISHVAMYIGNGKIIHASNSKPYPQGGIKISPYNYRTPVGYTRIAN